MLAENINRLRQELGHAQLVVVSKNRSIREIKAVYDTGQRVFAENRVQALLERREALPEDISWHLIGHLQTNKVRYITPFVSCIQSIDSERLIEEIDRQAQKNDRLIDGLLQIYIADEDTKFGLDEAECMAIISQYVGGKWSHVRLRGLMGMATNTDDAEKIKSEFLKLRKLFDDIRQAYPQLNFDTVSMGMSSDYPLAVACGSTLVRIGSKVFEMIEE